MLALVWVSGLSAFPFCVLLLSCPVGLWALGSGVRPLKPLTHANPLWGVEIWHVSISRPCEVPGPILSTQVGRTSTLGSLLGPGARGIVHSVNCEQAVHSHFRALSVGAAHAIACDGRTRERMSKRLVVARTASRYSMTL